MGENGAVRRKADFGLFGAYRSITLLGPYAPYGAILGKFVAYKQTRDLHTSELTALHAQRLGSTVRF